MTFKVYVKDQSGNPIPGLFVQGSDEINGGGFPRSTDGNGYADVAMLNAKVGDRVTLVVLDPEYRFKGQVMGDSLVVTQDDQTLTLQLVPFV